MLHSDCCENLSCNNIIIIFLHRKVWCSYIFFKAQHATRLNVKELSIISNRTSVISVENINWLAFVMEIRYDFCELRTEFLSVV
jgi:hypothetical protein